jgi:hypothetical protein
MGPGYAGPFGHPPLAPGPGAPADHRVRRNWPGLAVAGVAALLSVSTLLPLVRVTRHSPVALPPALAAELSHSRSALGLWDGVGEARVTLVCALVACALGLIGRLSRNGRLAGAATIPGVVALVALLAVALRLGSIKSSVLAANTGAAPMALQVVLSRQTHVSLGIGWFLALLMTLATIGTGIAAFVLGRTDRR